ncbi:hypothetical protein JOF56_000434 [Kibdelosporangium banguiense]|uniref:Lipoprotein CseA n=1 Tax=Kibdelosporangium banguiense TaxID=1365924 RepID=A0ABS4T7Z0_9PSEU|nr:hypothetical protein [Kibdelosporangium banguiense]MBP2320049.1 hypothetical protein [Kibdelosporangium banguiense]
MRSAWMAILCVITLAVMSLSACGPANGGVQVEGRASQVTPPPSTPPPPSDETPSFDAVALLRADPKVSDKIKSTLTPCVQGRYPVDARYADVTEDGTADLIVTVVPCDSKAIVDAPDYLRGGGVLANYIYDLKPKPPVDVFASEDPGQLVEQRNGILQVIRWEYRTNDRSCCPSLQTSVLYKWSGTAFELFKK